MAQKGYNSYRGRRFGGRLFPVLVLVLVLLAACAFMLAQEHIIYSDDGSIRLDLPFLREKDTPEEPGDMNLVIEGEEQPEETPEQSVAAPQEVYGDHRLVELAALPGSGEALTNLLEQEGANGFVYTVRDKTGQVYLDSAVAIKSSSKGAAGTVDQLSWLCAQEDVVTVARLNCFHDSYFAWLNMESAGICQSGGHIWYDNISYHWIDPAKKPAREYVISLALECAQMGFDELLLEEMHYPVSGKLEKIDYSGNELGKAEALVLFLEELRAALEPYHVKISLLVDEQVLDADAAYVEASGLQLEKLLPLVDAVYCRTEEPDGARRKIAERTDGMEAIALIPVVSEKIDGYNWYISTK